MMLHTNNNAFRCSVTLSSNYATTGTVAVMVVLLRLFSAGGLKKNTPTQKSVGLVETDNHRCQHCEKNAKKSAIMQNNCKLCCG